MTRRRLGCIAGLLTAAAGLTVIAMVTWPLFGALLYGAVLGPAQEKRLQQPGAYEPAARAMARLCQSDPAFHGYAFDLQPPPFTPPEVVALHARFVSLGEDWASVGFGGGHHAHGYRLRRVGSDEAVSRWELTYDSDRTGPMDEEFGAVLFAFELDLSERYTRTELIDRSMATFEERAGSGGRYTEVRGRIRFLLRHGEDDLARQSIREFAGRFPESWIETLLLFVLDAAEDEADASERLNGWASEVDDYARWIFAAHAYLAIGDIDGAESAARRALAHRPEDVPGVPYNARHRAAPVAWRLFEAGRYETAVALSETLLAYTGAGDHLEDVLEALVAEADVPEWTPWNPFEGIDVERLQGRGPTSPLH